MQEEWSKADVSTLPRTDRGEPLSASIPSAGVDLLQLNKAPGFGRRSGCRDAMRLGLGQLRTNEKCET